MEIKGLKFKQGSGFSSLELADLTFVDCVFDQTHFSEAELVNVTFDRCEFYGTSFERAHFERVTFLRSSLHEVLFPGAVLTAVAWSESELLESSFEDAMFRGCTFFKACLRGSHFLQAQLDASTKFIKTDLQDVAFFRPIDELFADPISAESAVLTKPIVSVLGYSEDKGVTTPKCISRLKEANLLPVRIMAHPVFDNEINTKVEEALQNLEEEPQSRAKWLINRLDQKELICQKAEVLASFVQGIVLPGGEDLPTGLYTQTAELKQDYRRCMLEIALIYEAEKRHLPLFAICRGFQILNIYHGAILTQDVGQREGKVRLKGREVLPSLFAGFFKKTREVMVEHHQAVLLDNAPLEPLRILADIDSMVYAVDRNDGLPIFGVQFHPEYESETKELWERFSNEALARFQTKA